jgi:tetratricopeptide (TPR) repeat protein
MNSKLIISIFLTSIATLFNIFVDYSIAQAGCPRWLCGIFSSRGSYSPPIIPLDQLGSSKNAVLEGRATGTDYLVLGHDAFRNGQYSEAEKYYSQANEMSAVAQDKEVQASAQLWLGEVNSKLGNQQQAVSHFTESGRLFNTIGDRQRANQVQIRNSQLQRQLQYHLPIQHREKIQQQIHP